MHSEYSGTESLPPQPNLISRLRLTVAQWEQMRAHVQACEPYEGCGVLIGQGERIQRVLPVENIARSPSRFRMDPKGQLSAFRQMEQEGLDLIGIFHSHPTHAGDSVALRGTPSETDVREAAYPVVQVIWSRGAADWQARGFWIVEKRTIEVELLVAGGG